MAGPPLSELDARLGHTAKLTCRMNGIATGLKACFVKKVPE